MVWRTATYGWLAILAVASAGRADEPKPRALFDGRSLQGWRVVNENFFDRHGPVDVRHGRIVLGAGQPGTAIAWKGEFPREQYEIRIEAARLDGDDFFCGVTFPVGEQYCTFIAGGWGGGVTGLSNVNNMSAVENETTGYVEFKQNQWYVIRVRVTKDRVRVWIDDKEAADVARGNNKFSIWWEQEPVRPLGVATWHTTAAIRKMEWLPLKIEKDASERDE